MGTEDRIVVWGSLFALARYILINYMERLACNA